MVLPKATAVLLFGSILATLFSVGGSLIPRNFFSDFFFVLSLIHPWNTGGSVTIVGAGGPYMKPMYDQLVFAYKFARDSVDIEVRPQSANYQHKSVEEAESHMRTHLLFST